MKNIIKGTSANSNKIGARIIIVIVVIIISVVVKLPSMFDFDNSRANVQITGIDQTDFDASGNVEFHVVLENQGTETSSYPMIKLESEEGFYYYLTLSPDMQPSDYMDVIDIPGETETWGTYVLSKEEYEEIVGETCIVTLDDYYEENDLYIEIEIQ